ncbi:MAG: hypothetical protein ACP5SH_03110 [Syntrophobacteraceae bacterium]
MAKYEDQDHYLDPESGVLKSKLGNEDEHVEKYVLCVNSRTFTEFSGVPAESSGMQR